MFLLSTVFDTSFAFSSVFDLKNLISTAIFSGLNRLGLHSVHPKVRYFDPNIAKEKDWMIRSSEANGRRCN